MYIRTNVTTRNVPLVTPRFHNLPKVPPDCLFVSPPDLPILKYYEKSKNLLEVFNFFANLGHVASL